MKTISESIELTNSTIINDQNVSNEHGKRSFEELKDSNEEQKKFKSDENDSNNDQKVMSKRQIKKMKKQQKWLEEKAKRKKMYKEKKEEKKKLKKELKMSGVEIKIVKTKKMAKSTCKQRIVLDMSYDDMMSNKDLCKCSNQILRCYGVNRRMENPMQLYFCSYEGKIKEIMAKHDGSKNWDINCIEDSFDKLFKKEDIVYLTSDSINILDTIDESKVYIIGGLVDHNSCKGASLRVAENLGIAHARLPIDEYINMKTRKILTINHVYEIISKVVCGIPWKEAFMETLPKRKMFSAKDKQDSLDDENDLFNDILKETENKLVVEENDSADN